MRPIIKWPGGKGRELGRIREWVPPHDLLVEPFVGGGALFFALEPPAALLNDSSGDLIAFYRAVREGDPALRARLTEFARDREELTRRAVRRAGRFGEVFARAREGGDRGEAESLATGPGDRRLRVDPGDLPARSVVSKVGRLLNLERKHGKVFSPTELAKHFETALQAGYYTAVRDREPEDAAARRARFFFLRSLCYGSMFRYSRSGRFNIPYGGISYNRVDFGSRVTRLFSPAVREKLRRAEFSAEDFEEHLARVRPRLGPRTFVFLDPPYDTEFRNYANRGFGREDHERLARVFATLPCPALLVIQRSDYIHGLYREVGGERTARGEPFGMVAYGKQYGYNVRGRNERHTTHLLVRNYPAPNREPYGGGNDP